MVVMDKEIIVSLFNDHVIEVFIVKDGLVNNLKIGCEMIPKKVFFYPQTSKFIICEGFEGVTAVRVLDSDGNLSGFTKFAGEEITAFDFSCDRAIACMVTNERTLRFFDFEELS